MNPIISIIIVNWNSGDLLSNAVSSIIKNSFENYEIIIVDNCSKDNSIDFVSENNQIIIVRNESNLGFGVACNQGISIARGKFILFFNPDAMVYDITLSQCVNFMNKHNKVGILGVKLIDELGKTSPSCSRFPSWLNFLFECLGLTKLYPRFFKPATIMNDWDHESSMTVNQVMGAFMFCRSDIFDKIGVFDEDFFVYYEDMDFCYRAKQRGIVVYYNHKIKAYHKGRGTTDQIKSVRLFYSLSSRLKFARKHFKLINYCITLTITLVFEPFSRIIFALINWDLKSIKETLKAYKMLYKS